MVDNNKKLPIEFDNEVFEFGSDKKYANKIASVENACMHCYTFSQRKRRFSKKISPVIIQ